MDSRQLIQKLLDGTALEEEINLLRQLLANGEISIGGNVNDSVIVQGMGNHVEVYQLTNEALEKINGFSLLGGLKRELTGNEIAVGLKVLETELPIRAPVLLPQFREQARRLRSSKNTESAALSDMARKERETALALVNGLCVEVLDISFNALCLGEKPPEYDSRSPFRGLESFRVEDSEFFFGREELIKKLIKKIQAYSFLAVLGTSGSGKSSLVMAGLIPALGLEYAIFRPGTDALEALESAKDKPLLVVDQFEELFTLTRDNAVRKRFISQLLEIANKTKVVITLRSDFMGEVAEYRELNEEIQNHLENVPPMDSDELLRAIDGQANVVGLLFEADLSQQILDDVAGEPGAMPLLQHALWELWNRRHGRNLRASEYRAFGRVKQAITSTAEKVYDECSKPEQEQIRDIFLRLTRLDEGDDGRDTRRRVLLSDLISSGVDAVSISALLDRLANARLIVKTVNEDITEIEVAHEALIRHWERLRIWLYEDRDNLRLMETLSESAREWNKAGCDESLLNHRGGRLELALAISKFPYFKLNSVEQAYLDACLNSQNHRARINRQITTGFVVVFILVLVIAVFAGTQWQKAKQQTMISRAGELAALATAIQNDQLDLAFLLGIEAFKTQDYYQSRKILLDNFQSSKHLRAYFWTGYAEVRGLAFSPNGKTIAFATSDRTVSFWDINSRKEVGEPLSASVFGPVNSIQFNFKRNLLLASGQIGVIVWDASTGVYVCHTGNYASVQDGSLGVTSATFFPDGQAIAFSKGRDVTIVLLNENGCNNYPDPFFIDSQIINSIAIDPTGQILAVGSRDKTIKLLDVKSGSLITEPLTGHTNSVTSLAFSPDGKILATGGADNSVILWDMNTFEPIGQPLLEHSGEITNLLFSPNGDLLASSSEDKTIIIWDVINQTPSYSPLIGHSSDITGISFSPDSHFIVSGGLDGSIILWDLSNNSILETSLSVNIVDTNKIAISPDINLIGIGKQDGSVLIMDPINQKYIVDSESVHSSAVTSLNFSDDGLLMVSSSCHKVDEQGKCLQSEVLLWDSQSGKSLGLPLVTNPDEQHNAAGITDLSTSPSNKYLVLISCGLENGNAYQGCNLGSVDVWDIETREEIRTYFGMNSYSVAFNPENNFFVTGGCEFNTFGNCAKGVLWINLLMPNGISDALSEVVVGRDWSWIVAHDGQISSLEFNSNGTRLASGSTDGSIILWNTKNLQFISKLPIRYQYALMARLDQSQPIQPLSVPIVMHTDTITSLSFSPDGSLLVSGGADNKLILWDVNTQQHLSILSDNYRNEIVVARFSPDGKKLISGNGIDEISIWNVDTQGWIDLSCFIAGRNFTYSEWAQYFPGETYRVTCPNLPIGPEPTEIP